MRGENQSVPSSQNLSKSSTEWNQLPQETQQTNKPGQSHIVTETRSEPKHSDSQSPTSENTGNTERKVTYGEAPLPLPKIPLLDND